jgi:pimeloyl-ACP methyl ester carboxylesterase
VATIVIVHGGWGGGWEWTPVARLLREMGHQVFTPTLTGMGERSHLNAADIGLSDHIADIVAMLVFEDLHDVVLCGHSYGGMVVTGVADRVPERIRLVTYLDAFTPEDGQALADLVPSDVADGLLTSAETGGIPAPADLLPPEGELPNDVRSRYIERLVAQPVATVTDPVELTGAIHTLRRAFVSCSGDDTMDGFAEQARVAGWPSRDLPTRHDLQLFDPDGTAAVIDDLVTAEA